MDKFFDVIYSGQLASNVQGDEAVKQFSILFKISQEKSRNIVLGNKEFVIKKILIGPRLKNIKKNYPKLD